MKSCRACQHNVLHSLLNLGMQPLANNYLTEEQLKEGEIYYPLHAWVCEKCYLVQLDYSVPVEKMFSHYDYFSSYSKFWLQHTKKFADKAIEELNLNKKSFVVEIASNDGCLLKNFVDQHIPAIGIEPAKNIAEHAQGLGIETICDFFDKTLVATLIKDYKKADLIIANNVLAHVPDLDEFLGAMSLFIKEEGTISIEVPHVLALINCNEYDTIYHEHMYYFSLFSLEKIVERQGFCISNVEILSTHGGSLRLYLQKSAYCKSPNIKNIELVRSRESMSGIDNIKTYKKYVEKVRLAKIEFLNFLVAERKANRQVVGYGAPAKGNTLLNYCGIGSDLIQYTVDKNPNKQMKYLPGTHIPIYSPDTIKQTKPDTIVIFPWNIRDEIIASLHYVTQWEAQFVITTPELRVIE